MMEFVTLKSIISHAKISLDFTKSIEHALKIMAEKSISSVVIVDADMHPIGIFTEHDALHVVAEKIDIQKSLAEVMTPYPFCVQESLYIHDAYMMMETKGYHHLVVVDDLKKFVGIVSEGDFLRHVGFEDLNKFKIVSDIMSGSPLIVQSNTSLIETAALMKNRKCDYAIVLDTNSHPIGLITERDIAKWCINCNIQTDETVASLLRADFKTQNSLKYLKLFESLPDGVVLVDITTMRAVEFNSAAHRYLGYTASEFAKLRIPDYEVKETKEETARRFTAILERGFDSFETVHRAKDGALIDVWVNVVVIDLDGTPFFMAVYRDIAELKQTQRSLLTRQSELTRQKAFLHTLINTIPDLIWLKDSEGTYLACNEMFERLYNAKESEILGKNDFDFVDAELAQFFRRHDQAAIEAGGSCLNEEFLKFGDGSYAGYFETIKTPMKDAEGKVLGVIGVARDMSERKRKNEEAEQIQGLAHIGTWEWDIAQDIFTGSTEAYKIFGIDSNSKIKFKDVIEHFAPQDREKVTHQLFDASKKDKNIGSLYRVFDVNNGYKWIKTHTEFFYDKEHNPIKAMGIFQDLTEQIEYENTILRKDKDLGSVQRLAKIGSWRIDIESNVLEWSDETYRIFGIPKETPLTYGTFLKSIHPDDLEKVNNAWQAALRGNNYEIEHRILVDGEVRWVKEHARLESDTFGELSSGIGMVQDITEQKLYQERLETLANYDSLTGLASRAFLISYLQSSIEHAKRNKTQIALLMFDLDRFKDINDSYGHAAGDELLCHIANHFSSRLREGDLVSRIGGDEFAIVLENLSHPEDAGRLAKEMINNLALEYKLSAGALIHVGISVGIALYPDNGHNASDLLQHSDAALYKSKADGRGTYSYYTDELTNLARHRIECENDLRHAIENNEFEVYYQPQVHILSGRILGAEALVRWNHPLRGLVPPNEFIPIAEELGLISSIGEWVLNETCRQGKIWLDRGHRLTLAVNVSAHQIRYQNIPLVVENALKHSGYTASRLELELTESSLMQREEEVVEMLHLLRAKGIRLAIDDFGTGYSSLSYLKRFPIDVLKIDKSFVDDIPYDKDDMAIVSAIIAMGQALGFQILAEGVEREDQLEFLKARGCTMYQGYLKSKPAPAEEFEKLL